MATLIDSGSGGATVGNLPATASRAVSTAGGDVPSAILLLSKSLRDGAGRTRLKNKTGNLAEKAALTLLSGSTVPLNNRDAKEYFGVFNATPDATPTWGELIVVINT